jgi:hypothetical protein
MLEVHHPRCLNVHFPTVAQYTFPWILPRFVGELFCHRYKLRVCGTMLNFFLSLKALGSRMIFGTELDCPY